MPTKSDGFKFLNSKTRILITPFFGEIHILEPLEKSVFPIYKVYCPRTNKYLVLKVYLYINGKMSENYIRAIYLASASHENLIYTFTIQGREEIIDEIGNKVVFSYILMEYATNGDFWNLRLKRYISLDDKILRTYFHQLVSALEYLHSKGISHLDVKLENMIFDENFQLKLLDFDITQSRSDEPLLGTGTEDYRPPEQAKGFLEDPTKADIFSASIVLFVLKYGFFPFSENKKDLDGYMMHELLQEQPRLFWEIIERTCKADEEEVYSQDFIDLCKMMISYNPNERSSVEEIKKSKWYQGPVYQKDELKLAMQDLIESYQDQSLKGKLTHGLKKLPIFPILAKFFSALPF